MPLDPTDYRKRVLTPFAKRRIGEVQAAIRELDRGPGEQPVQSIDIAEFYDLWSPTSDAAVAAHITVVEDCLNKVASNAALRTSASNLIGLHQRLSKNFSGLRTKAFWDEVLAQRQQRAHEGFAEFAEIIGAEFATLGVITATRLRDVARASGVGDEIGDAELAKAVAAHGVDVVAELPEITTPQRVLNEVRDGLNKTSCRSVLSAIFVKQGEPEHFGLVDGFQAGAGAMLTVAMVKEAHEQIDRLPDTDEYNAMGKVLGAIRGAVSTDAELHQLVLGCFVQHARQSLRTKPLQLAAVTELERTGLDRRDAARIVEAVGSSDSQQPRGHAAVQELVANGRLKDARRLYDATSAESGGSGGEEQAKARAAVEDAERRVAELRARAEGAVHAGDVETARRALNEALAVCTDDESLVVAAGALPPAAPLRLAVTSTSEGTGVRLTWDAGFGTTDDVRYQVVRKAGSAPQNAHDGTAVGTGVVDTTFEDARPPVAVELFYAVAATRGGGFSPVVSSSLILAPPVRDVRTSSDDSSVTLGWAAPTGAQMIEVVQVAPDGTSRKIPVGTHSGATSRGLTLGATYTYLITAVYTSAAGGELRSDAVRVTGVPRGVARGIDSFTLSAFEAGELQQVEATWEPIQGYVVEIWHFAHRPPWRPGTRVSMESVRAAGRQLAGRVATAGHLEGVRGTTTGGLRYYVALTRDGDEAITSPVQPFGTAPPVIDVQAERFGEEVVLAWQWPGSTYEALVSWDFGGVTGERTISPARYRSEGGCRIEVGRSAGTIQVATVASDGATTWLSIPTSLTLQGTASVAYDVDFQRRLFGPPASATVRISADGPAEPFEVVVIGQRGKFMPFDQMQGTTLARTKVVPGDDAELSVSLPRGKGTFWVRAFSTTPGVRLIDPPPTRMKVD